jgi:hypothetical protein
LRYCPGNNKKGYATIIILLMKGQIDCLIIISRMLKFIGGEMGVPGCGILVRKRGNNRVNFSESQSGLLLFGGNFFFYSGTAVSNLYHLANEDHCPAFLPQEFKY